MATKRARTCSSMVYLFIGCSAFAIATVDVSIRPTNQALRGCKQNTKRICRKPNIIIKTTVHMAQTKNEYQQQRTGPENNVQISNKQHVRVHQRSQHEKQHLPIFYSIESKQSQDLARKPTAIQAAGAGESQEQFDRNYVFFFSFSLWRAPAACFAAYSYLTRCVFMFEKCSPLCVAGQVPVRTSSTCQKTRVLYVRFLLASNNGCVQQCECVGVGWSHIFLIRKEAIRLTTFQTL